jgi:hypothetical protein
VIRAAKFLGAGDEHFRCGETLQADSEKMIGGICRDGDFRLM